MSTPSGWPKGDVQFITDCDWSNVSAKQRSQLRPSMNNPKKPCKRVRIRPIDDKSHPAHGQRGLFARAALKPGSHVIDYVGVIRDSSSESKTSDYILAFTEDLSIDAEERGNEARFINDFRGTGGQQNVRFDLYESHGGKRLGVFVMSKPIRKGEELLVTYGRGFWKARGLLSAPAPPTDGKQGKKA